MPEVLLVRALGGDDRDAEALRAKGVPVVEDPYLVVAPCSDAGAVERARHCLDQIASGADWLVVTSQAALRALDSLVAADALPQALASGQDRGLRIATVGAATREALKARGAHDVLVPAVATAAGLEEELARLAPGSVIAPQGSQAMKGLASGLRARGWQIDEQVLYETTTVPGRPLTADDLARGRFAAVVFRSPTAIRAVAQFVPHLPATTLAICGGPTTAAEAERLSIGTVVVSPGPTADTVAGTVVSAIG